MVLCNVNVYLFEQAFDSDNVVMVTILKLAEDAKRSGLRPGIRYGKDPLLQYQLNKSPTKNHSSVPKMCQKASWCTYWCSVPIGVHVTKCTKCTKTDLLKLTRDVV